jgi:hypothetical protein
MLRKKIAMLGSSHVHALMDGVDKTAENFYSRKLLQDFVGKHNIVQDDGSPRLRDDVAAWVNSSLDADLVLLTISGSDWLEFCASNRNPKIDIILPEAGDLVEELPEAQIIPLAEMRCQMAHRIRHVVRGIEALRKRVPMHIPIWYVASPPPHQDNEFVLRTVPFTRAAIEQNGVTDPLLRLKMYRLHSAIVMEACGAHGLRFVPPPTEGMTGRGFLAPECAGQDCLHANRRYGWYAIQEIERQVREM